MISCVSVCVCDYLTDVLCANIIYVKVDIKINQTLTELSDSDAPKKFSSGIYFFKVPAETNATLIGLI